MLVGRRRHAAVLVLLPVCLRRRGRALRVHGKDGEQPDDAGTERMNERSIDTPRTIGGRS